MVPNRVVFVVLLSFLTHFADAQCGFIQVDRFDNFWVCSNSEVLAFDKNHNRIGSYSNLLLGKPDYVDPLDPFRVLVFYKTKQKIVLLNNRVAELASSFDLANKGIDDATLVCKSSRGGFWIFDGLKWEIIHFNSMFNATNEKIIPEHYISESSPQYMVEYDGFLYVGFKNQGICRYDSYGSYKGTIPLSIDGFFSISDSTILYQTANSVYQYVIESKVNRPISIETNCLPVLFRGDYVYFDGNRLAVHKRR